MRGVDGPPIGELFLMLVGALFLALSAAPAEEMAPIENKMGSAQAVALVLLPLGFTHAFVDAVGFRGQAEVP